MSKFIITGKKKLQGSVPIFGNKNAILPIMAACLLTKKDCVLENVPPIKDVFIMAEILKELGAKVEFSKKNVLLINAAGVNKSSLKPGLVRELRASILVLAPLLSRFGQASLPSPGGCIIGSRGVETHFAALKTLGAQIEVKGKKFNARVKQKRAGYIFLDEASVTATENAMMMAALTEGETVIDDAACEPHVVDLALFLKKMGVKISGEGTNRLIIEGKKKLKGVRFEIGPDYIDAGAFAVLAAVTQSKLRIGPVRVRDLQMILLYFERFGVNFNLEKNNLLVGPANLKSPGKVQTRPWPGFPSDLMSLLIVLATQAQGTSLCHDWMFESRMYFTDKLIRMGAKIIACDPHRVLVSGPVSLYGEVLESPDIRAGMALVVAALCAQGKSEINNIRVIERGHAQVEKRLKEIGAQIKKID